MIDYQMTINRNAIMSMNSTRPDRIALAYANTGDICYHVGQMLADYVGTVRNCPDAAEGDRQLSEDVTAMLNESTIAAHLVLQLSHAQPRAGLAIDVITPDGQQLHRSIYAPSGSRAAAEIITAYLAEGAPGLRDDVRQSYEHQHRAFMERREQGKHEAA